MIAAFGMPLGIVILAALAIVRVIEAHRMRRQLREQKIQLLGLVRLLELAASRSSSYSIAQAERHALDTLATHSRMLASDLRAHFPEFFTGETSSRREDGDTPSPAQPDTARCNCNKCRVARGELGVGAVLSEERRRAGFSS